MPDLKEIIKVTKAQMETLQGGGSIGGHTLSDDVLYAVEKSDDAYDTVITNQSEFEAWCRELDNGKYTGRSVLFKDGEYTRNNSARIELPTSLKQIRGVGNVIINVTNVIMATESGEGAICYAKRPDPKDGYSIENITVNCEADEYGSKYSRAFCNCVNLIDCVGISSGGLLETYCFENCVNLVNCTGIIPKHTHTEYIFSNCKRLVNCWGGLPDGSDSNYVFYFCSYCSNCGRIAEPMLETSNVFSPYCSYVDSDTCPGYLATPPLQTSFEPISGWIASSAAVDTNLGKYYNDVYIRESSLPTIWSVRLIDNSTGTEVLADNRQVSDDGTSNPEGQYLRIYSDSNNIDLGVYITFTNR